MVDTISKEHRSWVMSRIRSKNTKPELVVRRIFHGLGYRFRIHRKDLPGKPDLVFPKYRTAVFVHGCFWHWHDCKFSRMPKSNTEFWEEKLRRNMERDMRNRVALEKEGWHLETIWECEVKDFAKLEKRLCEIESHFANLDGREPVYEGIPEAAEEQATYIRRRR